MKYSHENLSGEIKRRILGWPLINKEKLLKDIVSVFERIPEQDVAVLLSERWFYFVIPGNSEAISLTIAASTPHEAFDKVWIILLEPYLEKKQPQRITYTIARELVYCFLGVKEDTINTDAQLVKWGFIEEVKASKHIYTFWDDGPPITFISEKMIAQGNPC
jgi:hypothetical protein